jgi:hypothetical protein
VAVLVTDSKAFATEIFRDPVSPLNLTSMASTLLLHVAEIMYVSWESVVAVTGKRESQAPVNVVVKEEMVPPSTGLDMLSST